MWKGGLTPSCGHCPKLRTHSLRIVYRSVHMDANWQSAVHTVYNPFTIKNCKNVHTIYLFFSPRNLGGLRNKSRFFWACFHWLLICLVRSANTGSVSPRSCYLYIIVCIIGSRPNSFHLCVIVVLVCVCLSARLPPCLCWCFGCVDAVGPFKFVEAVADVTCYFCSDPAS